MRIGQFEVVTLSDGTFALDGGQMFGVVPKTLWEKKLAADARNRVRLGLTSALVLAGRHRILIETGIGNKLDAKHSDIYGIERSTTLIEALGEHGLTPADIDMVINTHLHFDHCGWNTRRDGSRTVPTFPRATYFIQRGEWEHAGQPNERDRGSYLEEFFMSAESQTELLEGNAEIIPGIRVEVFPGHTRHLQGVWIESEGERALFISDLVPTRAHLPYPWIMSFDLYPMETLATKKRLLPELARQRVRVIFPHDPGLSWSRVAERNGRIEAVPEAP